MNTISISEIINVFRHDTQWGKMISKGQLILRCPFGVLKSPKRPTKCLLHFPRLMIGWAIGQLISKCPSGVFKSPKKTTILFLGFLP